MNILIIQENGRHDKNENFRESKNLQRALFDIGNFNVIAWGLNHLNFNQTFYELEKWSDIIIILENYTPQWLPVDDIIKSKKLKLFWSIDSHCVLTQHIELCKKLKINILLNSTESYIPNFKGIVEKSYWFPNAYPDDLIYPKDIDKIHDVGFCGNINNRNSWLVYLEKYNIKKDIFVIGDDMVNAINSYKIHFNRNISDDINYRTFETTGCRTLLFTNYTPNLERLFNINEEIIVYENFNDLDEKINYYLNNENKRKDVENAGYEKAKTHHTYNNRAKTLIEIIKDY
jgi:hypothetical protein